MSMIGKSLAHYQITSLIGKGGMGEVYQAKDQKLGRDVAIKVLPPEFAQDTDRVNRFQREAKLLASLNHNNIAGIHGLEESDGVHFLVLELIEGQTLAERIKAGAIPVEEALRLGLQIAEALEAAHEKGVIHRDLKPANIKITPDGKVKVLDFGLAKAYAGSSEDINLSNSPTLSDAATQQGVILGTAAYMPPEQAKGKVVDKRADIWAFGVVLFEMLTGRQLFTGETVSEILASVIKSGPEWQNLPPNLHPRVRFLLEHCLKKEPKDRYSGISDARVDIQEVLDDPGGVLAQPVSTVESKVKSRQILLWASIAIILAVVAGIVVWNLKIPEPRRVMRFDYHLPEDQQFNWNPQGFVPLTVSPDGTHFVYGTPEGLYIRAVDELNARFIPGTDKNSDAPFFSPDGDWLGYWSGEENKLKKISISGGAPVVLCDQPSFFGASWNTDNTIILGTWGEGIKRVSADGGIPEVLIENPGGRLTFWPQLLPDKKSVLFGQWNGAASKVFVHSLESGETKELFDGDFLRYLPTGHIAYVLDGSIFVVPFDIDSLEVSGGAVPKVEGVSNVAVSETGTLVYIPGAISSTSGDGRTLVWSDREKKIEELNAPGKNYLFPKISPDGTRVALTIQDPAGSTDIWVWDIERKTLSRLTTYEGMDFQPIWTLDGKRIVFGTDRDSKYGSIYWRAADGTGKAEPLFSAPDLTVFPYSWSSDGKVLVMGENTGELLSPSDSWDIGILSMEGERERAPLLHEDYVEVQPQVSPDGRWIAYCSSESGEGVDVYVRPFPDVDKGKWQVSTNGGRSPRWAPDGQELLFFNNENEMVTVAVKTEPAFSLGTPEVLFESNFVGDSGSEGTVWDIHPDGERFLMMRRPGSVIETDSSGFSRIIVIVTNWFEELKEGVPVN